MTAETINQLVITSAWVTPAILGIVQVIKLSLPKLDERYMPVVSVITGIVMGMITIGFSILGGFVGLLLGLSAAGLWDVGKKSVAGK
jgi:hypothetical protein